MLTNNNNILDNLRRWRVPVFGFALFDLAATFAAALVLGLIVHRPSSSQYVKGTIGSTTVFYFFVLWAAGIVVHTLLGIQTPTNRWLLLR